MCKKKIETMKRVFCINFALIYYFAQIPLFILCDTVRPASSPLFLTVSDYEDYARQNLPKNLRDVILRGATDDDLTLRGNLEGFSKFRVLPRYLRDITNRSTKVEIMGRQFSMPIGIAPSDLHKRWHVNGEKETVKGAAGSGTIMILSVASSTLMEEVAEGAGGWEGEMWMQTFIFENRNWTLDYMMRAKAAGFRAIVLTVDRPVLPLRYFNIRNKFKDIHTEVNLEPYLKSGKIAQYPSWTDIRMMVGWNILPVIVKGLLTAEDAILAKEAGARGIIVSNHGGRQLDGAISSIEALYMIGQQYPQLVAKGTNNGFDIYLDSGIRNGLDVFRALALGAKFVFVGRAPLWGLYQSGHQGVTAVLDILRRELDNVMGMSGCQNLACIGPHLLKYFPSTG